MSRVQAECWTFLNISENQVAPQEKQITGAAQTEVQQAGGAADDDGYAPSTPMDTERKSSMR